MTVLDSSALPVLPSKWDGWPFNSGYGGDWQTTLATYAFSALILAAICLFLRVLYGPNGIWRDKEMEREAEETTRRELEHLEESLRAGRITKLEYAMKKRIIEQ